jgi:hypothetical protein
MRTLPAVLFALALLPRAASAEAPVPPARCTVKVVHALPGEGGIDPKITRLRHHFQHPPWTHWHTFRLLSEKEQELPPGGSAKYALPDGREATVTYVAHTLRPDGKHAVKGELSIDGPRVHSKTAFTLDEGGLYLTAGEKHGDGILIYSLSCKTEQ